jgi:hypothetical protein
MEDHPVDLGIKAKSNSSFTTEIELAEDHH